MTKTNAAGVAVALGFATVWLAPFEAAAKSGGAGFGARSFHFARPAFSNRPLAHRHRNFRQVPWVGGGASWPYYGPGPIVDTVRVGFVAPPEPPRALTCKRSQEIAKVLVEDGGIREIRTTRC